MTATTAALVHDGSTDHTVELTKFRQISHTVQILSILTPTTLWNYRPVHSDIIPDVHGFCFLTTLYQQLNMVLSMDSTNWSF